MRTYNSATVEKNLKSKTEGFHARARAAKEAHRAKRDEILADDRLTREAKQEDLTKLAELTNNQLRSIKEEQVAFVNGLRSEIERAVLGNQPTDANSVLLRRDAADRARRIKDEKEAVEVLNDAARSGDESLAHAVGYRARNSGWIDALEAYRAVQPTGAENATALAVVENLSSDTGYNLANQINYAEVSGS
ncbi:hypothetical protein [Agromyces sp. SYSU T00266]|uniref:hypothetical protein n=1 Tax=Agromyces zhanjiangensis TaxID=3158562 RepID=UPI0033966A1B